jgi:hypothetical protein
MPKPSLRRFTMGDLMILIAGCAAGIAWTQLYWADIVRSMKFIGTPTMRQSFNRFFEIPTPSLIMIGLGVLICRLRSPRPSLRRLARQPGSVALGCMALALMSEGILLAIGWAVAPTFDQLLPLPKTPGYVTVFPARDLSLIYRFGFVGMAIAVSWLMLAISGRWRPEPSWIDRTGRCLGIWWITANVASGLKLYLQV